MGEIIAAQMLNSLYGYAVLKLLATGPAGEAWDAGGYPVFVQIDMGSVPSAPYSPVFQAAV